MENTPDLAQFKISANQLPNGRWVAASYIGRDARGKRLEVKRRGGTEAEARAKVEADLLAHLEEREPAGRRTLSDAVDDWLQVLLAQETERGELAPSTRKKHHWLATTIKNDRVGSMRMENITTAEPIQAFLERHVDRLGRDNLRRIRRMLAGTFANEARHGRWSRPNWGELALIPPKARRRKGPSVLGLEAARHFLSEMQGNELEAAWRLQAIYGLRPGEVRGLLALNVVLDGDDPHVRIMNATTINEEGNEVIGPLKKDHHRARCPLDERTIKALELQFERLEFMESTSGLMFPTGGDTLMDRSSYMRRFRTALKHAGFRSPGDFSPYDLRHTSATLLYEDFGWTKGEVAAHLRHANLATVNVYLHADEIVMQPSPIAD